VLVTGAPGVIGSVVVAHLRDRWRLRPTDLRASAGIAALDVVDPGSCRAVFAGIDAVVRLGANPDPKRAGRSCAALTSMASTRCPLLRATAACGGWCLPPACRPYRLPRTPGSAGAAFHLDRPTSTVRRRHGRRHSGPGSLRPRAHRLWRFGLDTSPRALRWGEDATSRNLAAWPSPGDCVELIRAAVESDVTGLTIVNGVSANRYRLAELGEGREPPWIPTKR
jgi:uronate dehydrogenase